MSVQRRAIIYNSYGDPRRVCGLRIENISTSLEDHEVLVQWLAAPINPLDINKIQGMYVVKLPLPAVAGTEAMGRVVKTGSGVSSLKVGDPVVIFAMDSPVWSDYSVVDSESLIKIDPRLTPKEGATMMVNPPTAWLMLEMGKLAVGDWVIQNSANSGVGRAVIQIAKEKGFKTINIVRNRPDIADLKKELQSMGADVVWTEEELSTANKIWKGKPRLALNGVGGRSCLQISSLLARGGLLITYGGMSKKAHEISTSTLVFNGVTAVGVAIGMWMIQDENKEHVMKMLHELQEYYIRKVLTPPPMDEWELADFHQAISNSMDGRHAKQILMMNSPKISKL